MEIITKKCPNCEAPLDFTEEIDEYICPYCSMPLEMVINDQNRYELKIRTKELEHQRKMQEMLLKHEKDRWEHASKERDKENERQWNNKVKPIKLGAIILGVLAILAIIATFVINNSHKGKIQVKYSGSDCIGKQYNVLEKEFEDLGFSDIQTTEVRDIVRPMLQMKEEDSSKEDEETESVEWKDGVAESVSINGNTSFHKNEWLPADATVLIVYHTYGDQISMSKPAKYYRDKDYKDVESVFASSGFKNIECIEANDLIKGVLNKENTVKDISINGTNDFKADTIYASDAKIIITYHSFKKENETAPETEAVIENGIKVPLSSKKCSDKKYEDVVQAFEDAGFTNIIVEEMKDLTKDWLKKDGTVDSVSINGSLEFKEDAVFEKDSTIRIKYHSKEEQVEEVSETQDASTELDGETESETKGGIGAKIKSILPKKTK